MQYCNIGFQPNAPGQGKHFFLLTLMIDLDDIEDAIPRLPSTVD
ncbi:MAG: hypothetical protein ACTHMM_24510 [Agriterribacter sp.]